MNWVSRLKASGAHFFLSALVVASALAIVIFVWYPYPYYKTDGVWDVIKVLIVVDVVLGPLLTLVIFNKNKSLKSLSRDLAIIGCCQVAALTYGLNTIYSSRPLYLVFAVDRFEAIPAMDIDPQAIPDATVRAKPWVGPKLVYAQRPSGKEAQEKLLFEVLDGKPDLERRPEFYRNFKAHANQLVAHGITMGDLMKPQENREKQDRLDRFLAEHGGTGDDYVAFPLKGRTHDMVIAVHKVRAEVVGVIDLNPWVKLNVADKPKKAISQKPLTANKQADSPPLSAD